MKKTTWGLLIGAGLGLLIWMGAPRREASADRPLPSSSQLINQKGLIALSFEKDDTPPQVVVIDPETRAMSVYHIDRASGEITLKSVRNVRWDLQMEEFNGVNPTPREIRSLLERR